MRFVDLRNTRGNALLGAMGAVVIAGAVGLAAMSYNDSFQHTSRVVYVRALQASLESAMRFRAMQPYAYACGREVLGTAHQADGIGSCVMQSGYFDALKIKVAGAKCPTMMGNNCGFDVAIAAFSTRPDASGKTVGVFNGKISYQGAEVSVAPAVVTMDVPTEVLQSQDIDCSQVDDGKSPVFSGFKPDGSADCRPFTECPTGSYVVGLDVPRATVTCQPLSAQDNKLDCSTSPFDQPMITQMSWSNGVISAACGSVPSPPAVN